MKYPKQTDSAIFRNRLLLCKTRIDAFKLENSAEGKSIFKNVRTIAEYVSEHRKK